MFNSAIFLFSATLNIVPSIHYISKDFNLWHYRLGHLSDERLHALRTQYPFISFEKIHLCDIYNRAIQKKLPFTLSTSKTTVVFDFIHMDIWGPCSINSMQGFKYCLTVVDDFSRYTCTFLLHAKSEVRQKIVSFIAYIENHFHTTAKIIRMDNGSEFSMKDFFSSKGIIHQTTCIETPKQNGIVERKHQQLLNITRALIFQAHLPSLFWDFAVQHATYLINCTPTPTPLLQNIAPYVKLHDKPCDISNLRVFGCLC